MNRRVPNKNVMRYTIVGDGKVAKHFCHYFSMIGVDYNTWSRKQSISTLKTNIKSSDVVLILISDTAIEAFVNKYSFLHQSTLVHFSGTVSIKNVLGCHPLMTFSEQLYDLSVYESIPFICDNDIVFNKIFPQLIKNRWFNIDATQKAFYHAMCVMAGNFSQTLMRATANELSHTMELPNDILFPYLLQNTKNFITNPDNSATGPIQRGDFTTVKKHLHTLRYHPLGQVYQSFVKLNSTHSSHLKSINPLVESLPNNQLEAAK